MLNLWQQELLVSICPKLFVSILRKRKKKKLTSGRNPVTHQAGSGRCSGQHCPRTWRCCDRAVTNRGAVGSHSVSPWTRYLRRYRCTWGAKWSRDISPCSREMTHPYPVSPLSLSVGLIPTQSICLQASRDDPSRFLVKASVLRRAKEPYPKQVFSQNSLETVTVYTFVSSPIDWKE